jgi:hypothetical protein
MLCLMPRQSPLSLIHLVSEPSCLFFVPIRSVEPLERFDKPAVPKGGYAEFSVQVFPIRAVHERRIAENREMGKRDFAKRCLIPLFRRCIEVSVPGRRCWWLGPAKLKSDC